jgi:flagella basal body P-ring formation protein FlgA
MTGIQGMVGKLGRLTADGAGGRIARVARHWWRFWVAVLVLAVALLVGAIGAGAQEIVPPGTPEAKVRAALKSALTARIPDEPERVVVSDLSLPREFALPEGARVKVRLPNRDRLLGHMSFQVDVIAPPHRATYWATARVEMLAEVVVARRTLGRGEVLAPDDLTTASLPLSRLPAGTVTGPGELLGQQVAQRIRPGQPVTEKLVEAAPVVFRGDRLTLVVRRPGLTVTAVGEAREDGAPDHVISVINLSSRRTVRARVLDAQTAQVEY